MNRISRMDPEALVKLLGKDMMSFLQDQGRAALREIVTTANKEGVKANQLPYVFWALANQSGLPNLGPRQKAFTLMLDILTRTGVMPDYQRGFQAVDDARLDEVVDLVAQHMSVWAAKTMAVELVLGYYKLQVKHESKVPEATNGKIPAVVGATYLDRVFREILTLRSAWFEDGELLRRVVRFIPE